MRKYVSDIRLRNWPKISRIWK